MSWFWSPCWPLALSLQWLVVRQTEDSPTPTPESGSAYTAQGGISVSGTAFISLAPDVATIVLGVEALDETVAQARTDAAAAMTRIVDVLTAAGVADVDIQTQHLSIQPQYDYSGETRELKGFTVVNIVNVTVRDIESVGAVIDQTVDAGGDLTRIQSIYFSVDDSFLLRRSAHRGGRTGRHRQGPTPRRSHRRYPRQTYLHQLRRRRPLPRPRPFIQHRHGRIRCLRYPSQSRRSRDISDRWHHLCHQLTPYHLPVKSIGAIAKQSPRFLTLIQAV